jgi:hypothetical protein
VAGLRIVLIATALSAPALARAGETACHFEAGVVTAPAEVAGIAGDFIIDTGSPRTLVDETHAREAGFEPPDLAAQVRFAGVAAEVSAGVQPLDVRTWNLPTAVAGVIGADVLKAYVVDVRFAPCRLRLSRPGRAPGFAGRRLKLEWDNGAPTVRAAASDGERWVEGPFVVATGQNVPVRLATDLAGAPGAAKPRELMPDGVWLARLPTLKFAGVQIADLAAGLMPPQGETAGVIGAEALSRFRLRFDFPRGELVVAPAK